MSNVFVSRLVINSASQPGIDPIWDIVAEVYDYSPQGYSALDVQVGDIVIDENLDTVISNRWKVINITLASGINLECRLEWDDNGEADPNGPYCSDAVISRASPFRRAAESPSVGLLRVSESLQTATENINQRVANDTDFVTFDLKNNVAAGDIAFCQAGEDLVFLDLVYLNSDGKYYKATSTDITKVPGIGLVLQTIDTNAHGRVLIYGTIRYDSWSWTPGSLLYLDTAVGSITSDRPYTAGSIVQVIGCAISSNKIIFNPSIQINIAQEGKYYDEYTSQSIWTVNHNLNTPNIIVQCWNMINGSLEVVIPKSIVQDDINTATVNWSSQTTGRVCVVAVEEVAPAPPPA